MVSDNWMWSGYYMLGNQLICTLQASFIHILLFCYTMVYSVLCGQGILTLINISWNLRISVRHRWTATIAHVRNKTEARRVLLLIRQRGPQLKRPCRRRWRTITSYASEPRQQSELIHDPTDGATCPVLSDLWLRSIVKQPATATSCSSTAGKIPRLTSFPWQTKFTNVNFSSAIRFVSLFPVWASFPENVTDAEHYSTPQLPDSPFAR